MAVKKFRKEYKWKDVLPVDIASLESVLNKMGIQVNRKRMDGAGIIERPSFLLFRLAIKLCIINKALSSAQEKFLLGREIAFQFMNITPRPYETIIQHSDSFDMLLNNFKASYFSVALLMPEENFVEDVKRIVMQPKWNDKAWLDLCTKYDVTPEMMMQRLTNVLPNHFGIDHLFFLRMAGDPSKNEFEMTKELHLSQLHNPYANSLHEHYCRRWISINSH